jgi:phosphatidylglycerophosphate synthase
MGQRQTNVATSAQAFSAAVAARWLPTHATILLTGVGVSAVSAQSWPVATAAGLAFSALVLRFAGRWSGRGGFGLANLLTSARVLILLASAAWLALLPDWLLLGMLSVTFVLDAVDGAVARRFGTASEFGATFDTETDAAFVLVLCMSLWLRDGLGAWVLIPGLLRYLYVLSLALFPGTQERQPRPLFGRMAFLASATLLLLAKATHGTVAPAALGVAIACLSFGRSFLRAYPTWKRFLPIDERSLPSFFHAIVAILLFLAAWSFLNLTVNVRYPSPEPAGWYFLPSLDATVLLAVLGVIGLLGWRLPWTVRVALLAVLVVIRGLRIGDGVAGQSFGKLFNVYSDLPLVPELVRYAHATFSPWKFYGAATALLVAIALFVFLLDRTLAYLAAFFLRRWHGLVFAAAALPFAIASAFIHQDPRYNQRYAGAFGASVLPRVEREVTFLLNVYDHRMHQMQAIAAVQETLRTTPSQLEQLHRANLYLFFVESYGATVVNRPFYVAKALPALRALEGLLDANDFHSASGRLDSATYGGMSWLAHATFLTGVRTDSQLQYDLLTVAKPRTLARIAHEAGYRTVLVQPNTERQSRGADFYDFDENLMAWSFDYVGPRFAWATMPDQYVLDFTRRKALAKGIGPFFAAYVLVSSHAPWSHVPTLIDDWSQIGNGDIYRRLPVHRANTNWPDFSNASEPYLTSILYDLQVLGDYLTRFIRDDSLIIILGDHQPVTELTEDSPSWAVPVHVISRNPAFVQPFLGRGYAPGMVPGESSAPMASFLMDFLRDFSRGKS